MIITEKESGSLAGLSEKSYDNPILSLLLHRLCGVEVLQDIPELSCGNCATWAGRCLKGKRFKIANDEPCTEFIPRTQATFSTIRLRVFR
jgi:hypothetical protein